MSFKIALETETFCSIHPSLLGRQPDLKRLPAQLSKTEDVQTSTQLAGQFSGQDPFASGTELITAFKDFLCRCFSDNILKKDLVPRLMLGLFFRASSSSFRLCLLFLASPSYRNLQELCLPSPSALPALLVFPTMSLSLFLTDRFPQGEMWRIMEEWR